MSDTYEQGGAPDREIKLDDGRGGFGPGMEVFTIRGPRPVRELCEGEVVYALNPSTGLVKRKPIMRIERQAYQGRLVSIQTRRADILVAPNHPILRQTEHRPWPRFERASNLGNRAYHQFVNEWRLLPKPPLQTVDLTDLFDEFEACVTTPLHGHSFRAALPDGCLPVYNSQSVGYCFDATTFKQYQDAIESLGTEVGIRYGKKHRVRPYRFETDDFVRFLGWVVTEGSVSWRNDRQSATVQIAQQHPQHRAEIEALLHRMGFRFEDTGRAFRINSYVYGLALVSLCGSDSHSKRLPAWVWTLSSEHRRLLFQTLLAGDGNARGTYYTVSDELAGDVMALGVTLGIKPRYSRRQTVWQVYTNRVNDGFQTKRHLREKLLDGYTIRITVADSPAVLAGRDGKFQWVGVNGVA